MSHAYFDLTAEEASRITLSFLTMLVARGTWNTCPGLYGLNSSYSFLSNRNTLLQLLDRELEYSSITGLSTIRLIYTMLAILQTSDSQGKKLMENTKE